MQKNQVFEALDRIGERTVTREDLLARVRAFTDPGRPKFAPAIELQAIVMDARALGDPAITAIADQLEAHINANTVIR